MNQHDITEKKPAQDHAATETASILASPGEGGLFPSGLFDASRDSTWPACAEIPAASRTAQPEAELTKGEVIAAQAVPKQDGIS